ncbi:MAG: LysR family transcriptional regulator [Paracoccus sp. (in: a-proteobacteria)]|nr:LysR family transcriptional regulator [Paracoccus sp. (in: a-proteobacteria)]
MRPRRFLPSMSLLLAFEAVMRNRTVSDAARELSLTQSTVSRLIRTLEERLGQELFSRQKKRLIPTDAALAYQRELGRALDIIQRASMAVTANPDGGSLSLAVLPTFGTRWLAPRLPQFLSENPGITVNLSTRFERFDTLAESFDAVILYGQPDWPNMGRLKLFDERLTACAAPDFLDRHPVRGTQDLIGLTLLQLESRPSEWAAWFAANGHPGPAPRAGMLMDQFAMMVQAAIAGLGVALLPDYLARIEIAEGRLCAVLRRAQPGPGAYWLAWPEDKAESRPLIAFRDWISAQRFVDTGDAAQVGAG